MKILLATDGSEHAKVATRLLNEFPIDDSTDLVLLSNVFVPSGDPKALDPLLKEFEQHQEEEAEKHLAESEMLITKDLGSIKHTVVHGHIGHSIVEAAEKEGADIIVMGATGHSGVSRILLGSVSHYVATHAPCSVLIAREYRSASEDATFRTTIAYDGGEASNDALREFARWQWSDTQPVSLLGVVPILQGFSEDLLPNIVQYRSEQRVSTMRNLNEAKERLGSYREYASCDVVETEHVGEAIIDHLESDRTDIVVIGDTQRGMLGRLLLGSVSRYVLQHAGCSVWIGRSKTTSAT